MGRLVTKAERECVCGRGTVLVETTENDHPYLTNTNSWSREAPVRACAACGGLLWKAPPKLSEAEEKAESDAMWARLIENAKKK